jgi:hypothetical protein
MADESISNPPRPPLALRVGVTGARALTPEAVKGLRPLVVDALVYIKQETQRLGADPRAAAAYAPEAPVLRLLSPLAEGADRLVAEEALKAGFVLFAPLPFLQAEYEKDFPGSVETFRALLAQGEALELDGERGSFAEDGYRETGLFILRNCDLVIAIWDGAREHGPGGTGEIVRLAAQAHLPVWWIDSNGEASPRLVEGPAELRGSGDGDAKEKARLSRKLEQLILPPQLAHPEHGGFFGWCAHHLGRLFSRETEPLSCYLAETPRKDRAIWRAFTWIMDFFAPGDATEPPRLAPASTRAERYWDALYKGADGFAIAYGDRYRASYIWIAALAFVALAGAALSTSMPRRTELLIVGAEILALVLILALVFANIWHRWHEKWISYRLLAELCRKQYVLSSLGRALPKPEVFRMSYDSAEIEEPLPRDLWVAWYYSAAQRAAPFPLGSFANLKPAARSLLLTLCAEQTAYHSTRGDRNKKASALVGLVGEVSFVATLVFGALRFASVFVDKLTLVAWSGTIGACLSAASGAFVGIKAYSEFSLLTRQSTHMLRVLKETEAELATVEEDEPLASKELGRIMDGLTLSMMQDVAGWAQLFRLKTLEAGA